MSVEPGGYLFMHSPHALIEKSKRQKQPARFRLLFQIERFSFFSFFFPKARMDPQWQVENSTC